MKLVKSLLLGSAAGIVAVGSAVAADLPVRKAAPVDYVQVCSQFGAGFFFIPGTDTCLSIRGHVRWQGTITDQQWQPNVNAIVNQALQQPTVVPGIGRAAQRQQGFNSEFTFRALTATEFGTLESLVRLTNGAPDRAFVDFAGLRAGQFPTIFTGGGSAGWTNAGGLRTLTNVLQISYTADLGAISATFAIQNGTNWNNFVAGEGAVWQPGFIWNAGNARIQNVGNTQNRGIYNSNATTMPDLLARVEGSFGDVDFHLAGALTQLRTTQRETLVNNQGAFLSTDYGWALTGRVDVALGTISPNTSMAISASYADGALWYISPIQGFGRYTLRYADAYIVNDGVSTSTGWNVYGELSHGWAPNFTQTVYGVYGEVNVPAAVRRQVAAGQTPFNLQTDPNSATYWQLGNKFEWNPVANLMMGLDVNYTQVEAQNRVLVAGQANTGNARYSRTSDAWAATMRIQRNF